MLSSGTFRPVFIYEAVASHCCQLIISSFPSFNEYEPKMLAQTKLNLRKAQITYNKCVFHFSQFDRMMRSLLAKWFQASTLQFVLKEAVKKTNTSLLETPFWSGDFIYMKCLRVSYKPKEKTNKLIFVTLELRGRKEGAANWWLLKTSAFHSEYQILTQIVVIWINTSWVTCREQRTGESDQWAHQH